jgi:hypothetical protein
MHTRKNEQVHTYAHPQEKSLEVVEFAALVKRELLPAIVFIQQAAHGVPMSEEEQLARSLLSTATIALQAAGLVTFGRLQQNPRVPASVPTVETLRAEEGRGKQFSDFVKAEGKAGNRAATFCAAGCGAVETVRAPFKRCAQCKLTR